MTMINKPSPQDQKATLLAITLLVSVTLNLFLGVWMGMGLGHCMKGNKTHFALMDLASHHGETMDNWTSHLAPADAEIIQQIMQPQAEALRQAHDRVHQAVKDISFVYEQEPPDTAALQVAIDRLNQAKADVNTIVDKIVEESYPKLSSDGRHRLAEMGR